LQQPVFNKISLGYWLEKLDQLFLNNLLWM